LTPFGTCGTTLEKEAVQDGFGGPLEPRGHWNSLREVQDATWSRRLSKGSVSHIAITRQLEGARRHYSPGSLVERPWRSIGTAKPLGNRLKDSGANLESAPLQRVSVAQSDQRQLEGAGSHFLPRRSRRAAFDTHWTRKAMELAS